MVLSTETKNRILNSAENLLEVIRETEFSDWNETGKDLFHMVRDTSIIDYMRSRKTVSSRFIRKVSKYSDYVTTMDTSMDNLRNFVEDIIPVLVLFSLISFVIFKKESRDSDGIRKAIAMSEAMYRLKKDEGSFTYDTLMYKTALYL